LIHVVAIFITALFPILPGNRPCVETSATDAVTYQTIAAYYGNGLGATYLRDPSGQRVSQLSLRTDNGSGGLHTMLANIRRYDGLNRLDSTAWNATEHVAGGTKALSYHGYQYNALDQRTRADLLDGTFWDFGYDDRGGVTRAEHKESGGTELAGQQFGFSYDGIGNRTAASDGTAASSLPNGYTPSVLNQYSQVGDSGTRHVLGKAPTTSTVTVNSAATTRQSEWFSSAIVADNTSGAVWQSVAVSDGTATVNGSLFIPAASVAPQYDADGNLTSDGRWNFTWDAENRLVGMEPTATALAAGVPYQRWAHIYDSNSRRIASERYDSVSAVTPDAVEKAVYDGWNRVAELDGSNAVLRTFAWGLDMTDSIQGGGGTGGLLWVDDVTHGKHFFGYDGNGNVALTVDAATGVPSAVYDYDPFGQVIRASGTYAQTNRYRFGTKQQGAGGFYDYGYRWLDPMTGRWLSRDPLGETGGLNLYGFLGNDGVNAWDLLGLSRYSWYEGGWVVAGLEDIVYAKADEFVQYQDGNRRLAEAGMADSQSDVGAGDILGSGSVQLVEGTKAHARHAGGQAAYAQAGARQDGSSTIGAAWYGFSRFTGELTGGQRVLESVTGMELIYHDPLSAGARDLSSDEIQQRFVGGSIQMIATATIMRSLGVSLKGASITGVAIPKIPSITAAQMQMLLRNVPLVARDLVSRALRCVLGKTKNSGTTTKNSGTTRVTSWADEGITPDLNSGRWVQLGEPTKLSFWMTGLPGPKAWIGKKFPFIRLEKSKVPYNNSVTADIPASQLQWPSGWEKWKGMLGQRQIKGGDK